MPSEEDESSEPSEPSESRELAQAAAKLQTVVILKETKTTDFSISIS